VVHGPYPSDEVLKHILWRNDEPELGITFLMRRVNEGGTKNSVALAVRSHLRRPCAVVARDVVRRAIRQRTVTCLEK
jgi:hypothetical protein